jgi:hypothetical protein
LPNNIAQSNQLVLNWLQALNNSSNSANAPLPSGDSAREDFHPDEEEMEATEASELVVSTLKKTTEMTGVTAVHTSQDQ